MKINFGKLILIYLCILVVSCTCFQKHIQALTSKVNELFGNKLWDDDNSPPVLKVDQDESVVPQCDKTNSKHLFGIDWRSISFKIANNWWLIAVSSLLPFILFWRIQYNMRKKLYEWKKIYVQKEKAHSYSRSRRLTLPDLTLAKHARRESLADTSLLKVTNRPRKLSQCNILQFRNTRKNSFERSDDSSSAEIKRVHLIRRRH